MLEFLLLIHKNYLGFFNKEKKAYSINRKFKKKIKI